MNVVDSSGWLEYFADGPNAGCFAPALEKIPELVVPTVSIYEVFKRVLQQRDEATALHAAALMQQGDVVDLTAPLALDAARLSGMLALPMADSIMLATAISRDAMLWTQMQTSQPCGVSDTSRRPVSPRARRSSEWRRAERRFHQTYHLRPA